MASRTISLDEVAYTRLRRQKRGGESFSDVVKRLTGKRSPMEFAGAWADVPDEEIDRMKRALKASRRLGDRKFRAKLARWRR